MSLVPDPRSLAETGGKDYIPSAPATAPACMVVTRLPEISATELADLVSRPISLPTSELVSLSRNEMVNGM